MNEQSLALSLSLALSFWSWLFCKLKKSTARLKNELMMMISTHHKEEKKSGGCFFFCLHHHHRFLCYFIFIERGGAVLHMYLCIQFIFWSFRQWPVTAITSDRMAKYNHNKIYWFRTEKGNMFWLLKQKWFNCRLSQLVLSGSDDFIYVINIKIGVDNY